MTLPDSQEQGLPGPRWHGDGTLTPRHELRVEQGLEAPRPALVAALRQRPQIAGATVATFGRRLTATLIDSVLLVVIIVMAAVLSALGLDPEVDDALIQERAASAIQLLLYGYLLLFNILGWSPVKRMLRLRIVRADGSPPGLGAGLSRMLISLLTPMLVGYFWAALDGRAQTWHDKASSTYVVWLGPEGATRQDARVEDRRLKDRRDEGWSLPD